MKYCDKCKVEVRGAAAKCPLCQNMLSVTGGGGYGDCESLYPNVKTVFKQFELFFKILIMSTVSAGVISVALNLILRGTGAWSVFVVAGIICFWTVLVIAFRKRNNIPRNIINQVIVISVFCIVWDYITGWRGWSLDFAFPCLCAGAMLGLGIVAKVLRLDGSDYIIYILSDAVFGIIPCVFFLTGTIRIPIPSILCISLSCISFVALLVFEWKNIRLELAKRFHLR